MGSEIIVLPILFIALPWLIFHYITKWKSASSITTEDENLLDELHDLARRLDDRMCTIERIIQAENPNWRALGCDPADLGIEDQRGRDFAPREFEGTRSNSPRRRT